MLRRLLAILRVVLLLALAVGFGASPALARDHQYSIAVSELPPEARQTLALILRGGPFPYSKDGSVFGNFERRLPPRPRGYYQEYTVPTPGVRHRGAQRLIAGRDGEIFYTADHYRNFIRIRK